MLRCVFLLASAQSLQNQRMRRRHRLRCSLDATSSRAIDCDAARDLMKIEVISGFALEMIRRGIIFSNPQSCLCPASLLVVTKRGNANGA
jgi:hypothetical protein